MRLSADEAALAALDRRSRDGDPQGAAEALSTLSEAHPDDPRVWNLLGLVRRDGRDPAGAAAAFRRAIALHPGFAAAHSNLAVLLQAGADLAGAAPHHAAAAQLAPNDADVVNNLGLFLHDSFRLEEAEEMFRRALALAPGHGDASINLAHSLLLRERWAEGFSLYESRPRPAIRGLREWDGSPVGHLLVLGEQGAGDTIQFARYARLARERAARVTLVAPAPLHGLLRRLDGADAVVEGIGGLRVDAWSALLSLPRLLGPSPAPALPEATHAHRIGLRWSGNPLQRANAFRALPTALAADLVARHPEREWHSLQTGETMPGAIDHQAEFTDFAATARLVDGLDLVISICTAVAHLAAAIGKPLWVPLHQPPDWRWGLGRESFWYPGARLFRQEHPTGWTPVVQAIDHALRTLPVRKP